MMRLQGFSVHHILAGKKNGTSYRLCQHSPRLKPSPNTGVTMGPSSGESGEASISVFTAARASGCFSKNPSSQNAAGPTLPWKTNTEDMMAAIRPHLALLHSDNKGAHLALKNHMTAAELRPECCSQNKPQRRCDFRF